MPAPISRTDEARAEPLELEILRQRAARYARRTDQSAEDSSSVVVFARGATRYAVPLEALREIRPLKSFCTIPGASDVVPGIVHYRGELLSAHDLQAFLAPGVKAPAAAWFIVLEHHRDRLALLADVVHGVELLLASRLSPAPLSLGEKAGGFRGVLDDGVLVLQPTSLLALSSFHAA